MNHFHHQHHAAKDNWFGWVVLVVAPAVLLVRRRYPAGVLAATFAATLAYALTGNQSGTEFFPLIVAFVGALAAGRRRAAQATLVAGYAGFVWAVPLITGSKLPTFVFAVALLAWLLVLLSVGELLRFRRERAAQAATAREEEARRRVSEERLQIARD